MKGYDAYLFDWGGTMMSLEREEPGPMHLWASVAAMPGAREAVEALSANAPCLLVTNARDSGSAEIELALERAGLGGLFSRIVCSREVGADKPSAEFFSAAAKAARDHCEARYGCGERTRSEAGELCEALAGNPVEPSSADASPARTAVWFRGAGARALLSFPGERRQAGRPRLLMIGDDPEKDCAGAERAGIDSALYDPDDRYGDYRGRRIRSLLELVDDGGKE